MRLKTLFLLKIKLKMKKVFGLFAMLLLLTGCDDGDITFKSFNFTNATAQACTNSGLIYKVQASEALLLQLAPNTLINAENIVSGVNTPRQIQLSGTNSLIYRTYNGPVSSTNICSAVPPANPAVVEEYSAQAGGALSVLTTKVINSQGVLTGYNHVITIVNATFTREDESIIITDNLFGSFVSAITYRFDFEDEDSNINLQTCNDSPVNGIFTVNGDEALVFDIQPFTFPVSNTITEIDFGITSETRGISFIEYSSTAVSTLFCDLVPPITPVATKRWEAESGKLRIETNVVGGGTAYEHVFFLDNVTFSNTLNPLEKFTINATGGYRVGKITTN
jgi:hypothetical protein